MAMKVSKFDGFRVTGIARSPTKPYAAGLYAPSSARVAIPIEANDDLVTAESRIHFREIFFGEPVMAR
jgi:hypothetical protein